MLKAVGYLSNGFKTRCPPESAISLNRQILLMHISTNTAINKSLRRSQYDTKKPEARRTGLLRRAPQDIRPDRRARDEKSTFRRRMNDPSIPGERRQRPSHQQRIDVEDSTESASIRGTHGIQRRWRRPLKRNEKGEFDSSSRGAKYDYRSNPEGNRALRRALKFGHKIDHTALGQSNSAIRRASKSTALYKDKIHTSEKDLFENAPPDRMSRRAAALKHGEEQERGLSMPEELHGAFDTSREHYRPRSPTGRHLDTPDRATHVYRAREKDDQVSSRASGRAFESYRKNLSETDDQQSHHRESHAPLSMPYTTPASEFLYGTSVVTAALLSSRRKLYKLYIYAGDNREASQQDNKIREMALKRSVVVERVQEDGLRLMSKMCAGRPHNGYILEASPLPKLPVTGFSAVGKRNGAFHVILDYQSREDEAVNGTDTNIEYQVSFPRYPFVLLLDGILDPGNLGAILRTAFFLGVDTVAISDRNSAPLSPVAIKASAGASETLPLVSVSKPGNFIDQCKSNGWKIYAAAAPSTGKRTGLGGYLSASDLENPVRRHPCLLMLGGEGEGLQWNIRRKADFDVGIDGPRIGQSKVDSLNVSVAAGLLCEAFLRKPFRGRKVNENALLDADMGTAGLSEVARVQADSENRIF